MRDFNGGNKFGGGGSRFGGRNSFSRDSGGRDGGRPMMHKAVCSDCGNSCEVPFRPTGDKPVYCSRCFEKNGGAAPSRSGGRRDFGGEQSFERKQMFSVVCDGCGENCEVPFRPTGGKPIYCSQCFNKGDRGDKGGKGPNSIGKSTDQYKQQFEMLNMKLDRLLNMLAPKAAKVEKKDEVKSAANDKLIEEVIVKAKKESKPKKAAKKVAEKKEVAKKPVAKKKKA